MAQNIWMTVGNHGGPLSVRVRATRVNSDGSPIMYVFQRGQSTLVADEDVADLLRLQVADQYGSMHSFLTKTPPSTTLSDQDQLRMQVQHLKHVVDALLVSNPDLAEKLGVATLEENNPLGGL